MNSFRIKMNLECNFHGKNFYRGIHHDWGNVDITQTQNFVEKPGYLRKLKIMIQFQKQKYVQFHIRTLF